MPRIAAILILAATTGVLGSCGGQPAGETPAGKHAAGTHTSTSAKPDKPVASAHAKVYAVAVNLRPSDLPGFKVAPEHDHATKQEAGLERKLFACIGQGHTEPALAEAASRQFQRKVSVFQVGVSSGVNVARTTAIAQSELAEMRSPHTRQCLQDYLNHFYSSGSLHGAEVSHISITPGTPPSFGTSGTFAWRIKADFTVRSIHVPLYVDVLGFVYGSARVTLISSGIPLAFPASGQEHLFSLLLARAKTSKP